MFFKRMIGWLGRGIGWILRCCWEIIKKLAFYLGLLSIIIIGIILGLLGNIILLFLSLLCSLFLLFLRGFSWLTLRLLIGTKMFGDKVGDYTEAFFGNIKNSFQKEEDAIQERYIKIMRTEV